MASPLTMISEWKCRTCFLFIDINTIYVFSPHFIIVEEEERMERHLEADIFQWHIFLYRKHVIFHTRPRINFRYEGGREKVSKIIEHHRYFIINNLHFLRFIFSSSNTFKRILFSNNKHCRNYNT